jgi:hypothetical protein
VLGVFLDDEELLVSYEEDESLACFVGVVVDDDAIVDEELDVSDEGEFLPLDEVDDDSLFDTDVDLTKVLGVVCIWLVSTIDSLGVIGSGITGGSRGVYGTAISFNGVFFFFFSKQQNMFRILMVNK